MHQGAPYIQYAIYPSQQPPPPTMKPYPQMSPAASVSAETRNMLNLLESLFKPELREKAILDLAKHRESLPDLGPSLWFGLGAIAILLQEIVSAYPLLNCPELLTKTTTNRVGSVLTLLQTLAFHPATRKGLLEAQICLFLYPFLRVMGDAAEGLRLTSLGVIAALVKTDDNDVMRYLLGTEIFPLCLKIMEFGSEFSKILATFIVQRLLLSELGLNYVCQLPERFKAVATALRNMVAQKTCSDRLVRHIVRCYLRLSDNPRACKALAQCLPEELRNDTYKEALENNIQIKQSLLKLLAKIGDEGAKRILEGNTNVQ